MSKLNKNNKFEIIPNSKTVILCTNNVDIIKLSKSIINDNALVITTKAKDIALDSKCEKLVRLLKIDDLFNYNFDTLSIGEKQMCQVCKALSSDKNTIIMADAISNVACINKDIVFKFMKKVDKTIIYITSNKEDIMYFDRLILYDGEVLINDKLNNSFEKEREFKKAGFNLPFMIDLSLKLKYYNLVSKPMTSMSRMVNKLWK